MKKKNNLHKQQLDELKAGWQRCQAEFDNFRRRTEEEKTKWHHDAQADVILQILPVVDNFELALTHLSDKQKEDPTVQGIFHIQAQLEAALHNMGVEKIKASVGGQFDPALHEAVDSTAGKGGTVIDSIVQHGYRLGNTILRPSKVVVRL
ncbi:MAG TPA: nucleotide exchange factor GrpE [bacterium]|nr:nucleotide exchange factor GrpE [bacterium]HOR57581.1 nucleotide exchange factor GrpE [bacterium]HPL56283.1 nucleotide exchange factor GrpE [bacterium]